MSSKQLSIPLVLITVLCLTLAACGNGDDGPVAVAEELFQRLEKRGFTAIADLVCAASRDDVAELFGLAELLDQTSGEGVAPGQVAELFIFEPSLTFQEVAASDDDATVYVRGSLKVTVDAARFKTLARQILEDQGAPDEERTEGALDQLYVDFAGEFERELSGRVDADLGLVKEDGKWLVCHWSPPDRPPATAAPRRQVNLDEDFTLRPDEAVAIAGTGLTLRLDMAGHTFSADPSNDTVFAELTAILDGTSHYLYVDLDNAKQRTVGDYVVHVLTIDGFGRDGCELRVVQQ
jgi:hypothetical protein